MKKKVRLARWIAVVSLAGATFGLWGCPNPNDIGVQQYGAVQATCTQASNGQPVAGALVTVAGVNPKSTDASGKVTLTQVPIGTHMITADSPGLHGENSVTIVENQTAQTQIKMSPTI